MFTTFRVTACDVDGGRDRRIDKIVLREPRCGEFRPPRRACAEAPSH
jgi:hypothetical protein